MYTACQTSKSTAITQWKGIALLTEVVAFVPTSLRCSCKRTIVTVKPRVQNIDERMVKAGKEDICIIRTFALHVAGL
jgi:hypothetical protein